MNMYRLMLAGLLIPTLLMIPYSIISFYTDFANKNPDPLQVTVEFRGKSYDAVEGKRAFEQYQCMGCHTIVGNGAYFAPDLTRVYKRFGENDDALAGFILTGTPAKGMPPMTGRGMGDEDAYHVVAFLKYTDRLDTNGWPGEGSWDRDGSPDAAQANKLIGADIWQIILGILLFNLMVFAVILNYERGKEEAERLEHG